jgi:pyruvate kinase
MITSTKPTNAEIADIHNAILDGADCLMLSGETAVGKNPVLAVATMARIAKRVENTLRQPQEFLCSNTSDSLTTSIGCISKNADSIICVTRSGYTARRVAGTRPMQPIIAVAENQTVAEQLALDWGITPIVCRLPASNRLAAAARFLLKKKLITKDSTILLIGRAYSKGNVIDTITIAKAKEIAG